MRNRYNKLAIIIVISLILVSGFSQLVTADLKQKQKDDEIRTPTKTVNREKDTTLQETNLQKEENIISSSVLDKENFVPGDLIIKFKSGVELTQSRSPNRFIRTNIKSLDRLNRKYQIKSFEKLFYNKENGNKRGNNLNELSNIYILKIPKNVNTESILEDFSKIEEVEYVEPNYILNFCEIPDDQKFDQQWALKNNNDCDIDAPHAWNVSKGSDSTIVAIVDSGVDYNHLDIADNIWINENEIPDNGIDDDGNGYIDDIRGWDFQCNDNDPMDDCSHGTHCAGIANAVTNNSIGIAGVAWNCKTMAVKIGDSDGIQGNHAAYGVFYAAENGADVISMSWGASGSFGDYYLIQDAINYAYGQGAVLVAAAGNDCSNNKNFPAAYDKVISVAATNQNDGKASFSNYGSWVDIAAPGMNILSSVPNNEYARYDGTSMACPHVAGLVGLILSNNDFNQEEVKTILRSTTDQVVSSKYIGIGRINAYSSIIINSTPIVNLNSNLDDVTVNGTIDIFGTVNGSIFGNYSIFYGEGIYPTSWNLLFSSSTSVDNGILYSWNTETVNDGSYTIKLVAFDIYGNKFIDMSVVEVKNIFCSISSPFEKESFSCDSNVTIVGSATGSNFQYYKIEYGLGINPTNWFSDRVILENDGIIPIESNILGRINLINIVDTSSYLTLNLTVYYNINYELYYKYSEVLIIVDPDYQIGWPQKVDYRLIAQSIGLCDVDNDGFSEIFEGESRYSVNDMSMYGWNYEGSNLLGWPKDLGSSMRSAPAFADIDEDGDFEIFVGTENGRIEAWHHDGTCVSGWPVNPGGKISAAITIADLDNDSNLEIIAGSHNQNLYAWSDDGTLCSGFPVNLGGTIIASPAVGDIDNDGDLEIIVGSSDRKVYALHHDGSIVEGWPKTTNEPAWSSPALADFDGDGNLEIVVAANKVYVWKHDGFLVEGWPRGCYKFDNAPAIADIDGNGDLEIIIMGNQEVLALNYNGTDVPGWPVQVYGECTSTSAAIGDINGDDDMEILIDSGGELNAFNHDGTVVEGWPKYIQTKNYIYQGKHYSRRRSPTLNDIDNDGDIEVIIASERHMYIWDLDAVYNPNNIEWGSFQNGIANNGLYITNQPTPSLNISPSSHNFGVLEKGETAETTFEIWNAGGGILDYTLSDNVSWLTVSPTSGFSIGEHNTITVEIDTNELSAGSHEADIYIVSNVGNELFKVDVTVQKPSATVDFIKLTYKDGTMIDMSIDVSTNFTFTAYSGAFNYSEGFIEFIDANWDINNYQGSNAIIDTTYGDSVEFNSGSTNGIATLTINDGEGHSCSVNFNIDSDLFTFNLYQGWNLITIPSNIIFTAKSLGNQINGCKIVSKFDAQNQIWTSYLLDISPDYYNFQIEKGVGYEIYMKHCTLFNINKDTIDSYSVDLYEGYNFIGWNKENEILASTLGSCITDCFSLAMWDAENQLPHQYLVGISPSSNDFEIKQGMGIMVYVETASTWYGNC